MASVANLVEFPDGLGLNVPLFVQCKWCFDASTTVEPTAETSDVLCELTMMDGNHCWAGPLRRRDLAGPLENSWKDPANLRLLREALVAPAAPSVTAPPLFMGGPTAESSWKVEHGELQLTVRFIYREGPVAAIQSARFPKVDLKDSLQTICRSVRALQEDVRKQKEQVQLERATPQQRQEVLKRRLEILPKEVEDHETQLLEALCGVLNAQKRRCRGLWESTCEAPEIAVERGAPTMSLEECLDREVPNVGLREDSPEPAGAPAAGPAGPAASLQIESATSMFSLSYDVARAETTFSIPLTLGMSRVALPSAPSGLSR